MVRNACKVIYNAITNALRQFVTVLFRFHTRILIGIAEKTHLYQNGWNFRKIKSG